MKITFVRHTSVDVEPGICYGRTDVALKPSFPEEAARVKSSIEEAIIKNGKAFDAIYRSPLSRCRLLAEACGYPDALPDSRLLEMDFGEWEMKRYDDIRDPRLQQWYDDWLHIIPTGGESFLDQNKRVRSFLEEMSASGQDNVLVFTHAGVIMNAMFVTGRATVENLFSFQPPYGGLVEITLP